MFLIETPKDYWTILKRRRWYVTIPLCLGLMIGIATALIWPPVYRSFATILIGESEIRGDLISSVVDSFTQQRIEIITKRIMTSSSLTAIIEKFDLYGKKRQRSPMGKVLKEMRENIRIVFIGGESAPATNRAAVRPTIAFELSFDYGNRQTAQDVLGELVFLYMAENLRMRRTTASETTRFLAREAEKYRISVEELETRIAVFKQRNTGKLPEQISIKIQQRVSVEREVLDIRRRLQSLREQRILLQSMSRSALQGEYDALKVKLATLRQKFSDSHPDVVKIRQQIEMVEGSLRNSQAIRTSTNPAYIEFQARLAANDSETRALDQQGASLDLLVSQLDQDILLAPEIEREYRQLIRDYQSILLSYTGIKEKQLQAEIVEALETQRKSEKFALLDGPSPPLDPVAPNRLAIVALSAIVALVVGVSLMLLTEVLDDRIYGPRQLANVMGKTPLVVVPHIKMRSVIERRQRSRVADVLTVVVLLLPIFQIAFGHSNGLLAFGELQLDRTIPLGWA